MYTEKNAQVNVSPLNGEPRSVNRRFRKSILAYVLVLTGAILCLCRDVMPSAWAQGAAASVRQIRVIDTGKRGLPNPAGLMYLPSSNRFLVVPEQGHTVPGSSRDASAVDPTWSRDTYFISPFGDFIDMVSVSDLSAKPLNLAFDPKRGRLLGLEPKDSQLFEREVRSNLRAGYGMGKRFDVSGLGLEDPQGTAVDPGTGVLFILDAAGPTIVRVEPGPDGGFGRPFVARVELHQAATKRLRGLAFDPATGHLHLFDPEERLLYEVTQTGVFEAARDLWGIALASPQSMTFAPSGDQTDDPSNMNLYVADSGMGGRIVEISIAQVQGISALAAEATPTGSLVQVIDTSQFLPPSPDPAGITYMGPPSDILLFSDSEVNEMSIFEGVNLFDITLWGGLLNTYSTLEFSREPTGVAHNPLDGHLFVSDDNQGEVFEVDLGPDGLYGTPDDVITSFDTQVFGSFDPEGVAFDSLQNVVFIADGVNAEIYRVAPGDNGLFDGVPPVGDDQVSSFDTASFGILDPEGITYDGDHNTLYVVGEPENLLVQFTTDGVLLRTLDISEANPDEPAGLAYAPGSLDPSVMNIYITDRGVDNNTDPNENDGAIYEMMLPPFTPGNMPPVVSAGPDLGITFPDSAILNGTVSDDGLPNPPGAVTTFWSLLSGPGTATFADASQVSTSCTFSVPGVYVLRLIADDGEVQSNDETTVTVYGASGEITREFRVVSGSDDAEEWSSGSMYVGSSDLELTFDESHQTVGMRFISVDIPRGALIQNAFIQFQTDEVTSTATSLTIHGEDIDNASTFISSSGNISSRPKTTASVDWLPPPWNSVGEAGPDQQTPDIAPVVQEILSRPGWASGNSLVIIVTGTGERVAESYNGSPGGAPLLRVTYSATQPPLAMDDTVSTDEDTPVQIAVLADNGNGPDSDGDGTIDPATVTIGAFPANGTILAVHPDGTVEYSPAEDFYGSDMFTYTVRDNFGVSSNAATVTVFVQAVNDDPSAQPDSFSMFAGGTLSGDLLGDNGNGPDSDVDGDPLSVNTVPVSGPSDGTLSLNSNGTFQYTPDAGFTGTDGFVYELQDGNGGTSQASVTVTVSDAGNQPPEAQDDSVNTDEDAPVQIAVLADNGNGPDSDSDGTIDPATVTIVTFPANGTILAVHPDGTVDYSPDNNYYGTDTFTYTVRDNEGSPSNPATVTVTVSAVNDDPSAQPDSFSMFAGGTLSGDLLGDNGNGPDSDVDGDPLSVNTVPVSGPSDGTLSLNSNGTFQYTPDAGFTGTDGFVYELQDGNGGTSQALVTVTVSPEGSGLTVFEVRISAGSDDAEEWVSGSVYLGSSDLELTFDGSHQTVGMRFNGVDIPRGATITNAYLQFQVDETPSAATSLTIHGEAIDNAPTFSNVGQNISSRQKTVAAVPWSPPAWPTVGAAGPDQRTPDIGAVIQEIVDRAGWVSGNSLVLIVTGTGERVAESYNGSPSGAPLLHVEYQVGPPSNQPPVVFAGTDQTISLPDDTVSIGGTVTDDGLPEGSSVSTTWSHAGGTGSGSVLFGDVNALQTTATITPANPGTYVLRLTAEDTELSADDEVTITLQDVSVLTEIMVTPNPALVALGGNQQFTAAGYDQYGGPMAITPVWTAGGGTIDNNGLYTAGSVPGDYTVTATDGLVSGIAAVSVTEVVSTIEIRVSAGSDDAEERVTDRVYLNSSDLEMTFDKFDQIIGMRFAGVAVPQGATIVKAYIQFTVDETTSVTTSLMIQGEASDDAPTFLNSGGNITSRNTTASAVPWLPPPWQTVGESGPDQQSPDIAAVVQEIVDRPGWASGNSMVMVITGTGERVAESYNGDASAAPLLHIEYSP